MALKKQTPKKKEVKVSIKKSNFKKTNSLNLPKEEKPVLQQVVPQETKNNGFPFFGKIVIGAVVIGIILFLVRGLFIVAIVNGTPITRFAVISELEAQGGKQVSSSLITKTIIMQGFAQKNITVSQKEADDEIKKISSQIKQQGSTLDQMLASQGETQKTFVERVKIQLMAQKLFANRIKVTDSDVQSYIDNNKQDPSVANATDQVVLKTQIKTQLQQQKLRDAFQAWVAQLEKNSSVLRFVNY